MRRRTFLVAALLAACSRRESSSTSSDPPWPQARVVRGKDLAREIAGAEPRPRVVHVGPEVLFKRARVPSAVHGGEAGDPDGLEALAHLLGSVPHDSDIVLYCGCCPYKDCPNIRPAYWRALALGIERVRVLDLPTNLKTDWTDHGLPVEKG